MTAKESGDRVPYFDRGYNLGPPVIFDPVALARGIRATTAELVAESNDPALRQIARTAFAETHIKLAEQGGLGSAVREALGNPFDEATTTD